MARRHMEAWSQPMGYQLETNQQLEALIGDLRVTKVVDHIDQIANGLFELDHPSELNDNLARLEYAASVVDEGIGFGTWFHYADTGTLVRFAPPDEHFRMRTSRNRNLITFEEQRRLYEKRVAVLGLSVGRCAVDALLQQGTGNDYLLFDPDRISVSNLNRLNAPFESVGELKTTDLGRRMSRLDPYIHQTHFPEGYSPEANEFLRETKPDVIVEEVDDMKAKAEIRMLAAELGIPLVMAGDADDKAILSVERHDLDHPCLFNGKLSKKEIDELLAGTMSDKDKEKALIKIIGMRNISFRLLASGPKIGTELAGMPQLGVTATIAGALVAETVRDIFLDRGVKSGNRVFNSRDVTKSHRTTTAKQSVGILKNFIAYRGSQGGEK